jgi:hypothetical protein
VGYLWYSGATWRDLADGGGVKSVLKVAVARLHEDGRVGQALESICESDWAEISGQNLKRPNVIF